MTSREPLIALVGNPNSGKTTLFNALTGLRQKVGNYPGVTVERKEGIAYTQHGKKVRILDLPGSYSLHARSPDEQILVDALLGRIRLLDSPDAVICCIDGSNLERNLYLATQVIEVGLPTVVAVNMMDVAERRGMRIDLKELSEKLGGVKVIGCEAARGKGVVELRLALSQEITRGKIDIGIPKLIEDAIKDVSVLLKGERKTTETLIRAEARLRLFGEDPGPVNTPEQTKIQLWQQRFDRELPGWRSELITKRYGWIGEMMRDTVKRFNPNRPSLTEAVDKWILHPVLGFLILGGILTLLFYSIFSLATPLMDIIESGVGMLGDLFSTVLADGAIKDLVVDGIVGGVGGVVVFLPQILFLFFFISLLESTGYMARGAFLLDRVMSKVGLHGRSFIPLLSSYACAVPGIMATRTIESPKDRLVTILVAPFMTCSARLPVYLVMIAALLPSGPGHAWLKAMLLLLLYILGTVTALAFALIFRKTLLRGPSQSMVMELPPYRLPQLRSVFQEMWDRSVIFLKRAGTIIFALSIVLWFLMNYPKMEETSTLEPKVVANAAESASAQSISSNNPGDSSDEVETGLTPGLENSFAGKLGHLLEPAFAPIGYDWQITVGIIASFAAREVFVSTMAIIYRVDDEGEEAGLLSAIRSAKRANGKQLFTPLTCLSILIFFVFALQCISTVAVVKRETQSWAWAIFQFTYMLAFAWIASFMVYQGGQLLGFQ